MLDIEGRVWYPFTPRALIQGSEHPQESKATLLSCPRAEKKFTIVFKRAPDYKIFAAPVIYGGPTPDGKGVLLNFCVDHGAFPSYVEHLIDANGRVNIQEINSVAQVGNVEREIQAGLYLSIEDAERTVMWLRDLIEKIKGERHE